VNSSTEVKIDTVRFFEFGKFGELVVTIKFLSFFNEEFMNDRNDSGAKKAVSEDASCIW
jgi:hypothetical protein